MIDHLVVLRAEDAPVDFHIVPDLNWVYATYGSSSPITIHMCIVFAMEHLMHVACLLLPTGADLETVLDEHYGTIRRQLPHSTIISFVAFDEVDVQAALDWIMEHDIANMTILAPT